MNCGRGHQRLTCSRSSGAGCPFLLTNVAVGAGRLVISLALFLVSSVTGEIRCFCNQPTCVSTSYMCKSQIGMCFLRTTQDGDITRTVHACADSLSENQRYACAAIDDDVTSTQKTSDEVPRLDLICCRKDMCNYKPRLFINIYISRMNGTSATESLIAEDYSNSVVVSRWSVSTGQLLWFRVAVIVVPSIGAFLLAVIVYAAVRMLRSDYIQRRHRKTRLRHHSAADRPLVSGCGVAKGPMITAEPYCIVLSSAAASVVAAAPQSKWRPLRIRPDEKSIRHEGHKSFEGDPLQDIRLDTTESICRVYGEPPLDTCHHSSSCPACEYSLQTLIKHKQNNNTNSLQRERT